jgi:hypothetical protein
LLSSSCAIDSGQRTKLLDYIIAAKQFLKATGAQESSICRLAAAASAKEKPRPVGRGFFKNICFFSC